MKNFLHTVRRRLRLPRPLARTEIRRPPRSAGTRVGGWLLAALLGVGTTRAADDPDWFAFDPPPDTFADSPIDLRGLNERFAGEHGFVTTQGAEFVQGSDRRPIRFWAVNGPPSGLDAEGLRRCARRLAKYGVNLVRLHGPIFDSAGDPDPRKIRRTQESVVALASEGIYAMLSIYFPLWMTPPANHPWLEGYDGKTHPFAALMFNPRFQEHYRSWWKAVLQTPDADGRRLTDSPALFAVEIQNEDSFFFWTFDSERIPSAQLEQIESRFATWAKQKYGSLDAARTRWGGQTAKRDRFDEGRAGIRPLWNMSHEKTVRDQDTARFLFETQRDFYLETIRFLRSLGFKGLITPSNWHTASPEIFGPLEKWSYTTGDFVDRHGYFGVTHQGDNAAWSIRAGHTYADRSALRFDNSVPGKPKEFAHPAMDVTYAGKPSMISETTWNRPNRFRGEAPLYLASFGALQDTDAIVHFALDGADWSVKPAFWMQPWTLMAPTQMAQFPAAALIYRRGLIRTGEVLARIDLGTEALSKLEGTPLPQEASFDELRLKDVPQNVSWQPGQRIDPLIHYAGRTEVAFTETPGRTTLQDLAPWVDRQAGVVRSSTRELTLDYRRGLLTFDAPQAQGASGHLASAGDISLTDIVLRSDLDNAHVVLVSLDGQPIARSRRMLLQAMSEERATGFATEDAGNGLRRITDIGRNPWQVKRLRGKVTFKSTDVLEVQPLDFHGYPRGASVEGGQLHLLPDTIYYRVTRKP